MRCGLLPVVVAGLCWWRWGKNVEAPKGWHASVALQSSPFGHASAEHVPVLTLVPVGWLPDPLGAYRSVGVAAP